MMSEIHALFIFLLKYHKARLKELKIDIFKAPHHICVNVKNYIFVTFTTMVRGKMKKNQDVSQTLIKSRINYRSKPFLSYMGIQFENSNQEISYNNYSKWPPSVSTHNNDQVSTCFEQPYREDLLKF